MSEPKLTKAEQRWRRFARQIWGHQLLGWSKPADPIKADAEMLERRVKAGHVERDDGGLYRLTDLGRACILDSDPMTEAVAEAIYNALGHSMMFPWGAVHPIGASLENDRARRAARAAIETYRKVSKDV